MLKRRVILTFLLMSVSMVNKTGSAQKIISVQDVKRGIDANKLKVSEGEFEMMKISLDDGGFLGDLGSETDDDRRNKIGNKKIVIVREKTLFSGLREVNAVNVAQVDAVNVLYRRSIAWKDAEGKTRTTLSDRVEGLDENGKFVVANRGESYVEVGGVGYRSSLPEMLIGPDSPDITEDYKLIGEVKYKNLKCLKLSFQNAATNFSREVLVCPERDFKILQMKSVSLYDDAEEKIAVSSTVSVEKMELIAGTWIPMQIREEHVRKRGQDAPLKRLSKLKVTSFKPNSLSVNSLFEPIIIPGTLILNRADPLAVSQVSGGDISALVTQFRAGDFTPLDEEESDLSQ
jgi:hypothetical protein